MRMIMQHRWTVMFALAASGALAACGDDGGDTSPVDAGPDAPPGAAREVIGLVDVHEQRYVLSDPPQDYPSGLVRAVFYDGRPARWHREVMRSGACVLKRYTPALCQPACADGLCVDTNVCEPWPRAVDAGRLTISGLAVAVRIAPMSGQYYPDGPLPVELFADDATVGASLVGSADFPPVELTTTGVPPLIVSLPQRKLVLDHGADFTMRWTPSGGPSRIRLTLNSNNQGHGAPYLGIIECEADDAAGEITIAAALIDGFPETRAWTVCAGSDCPPSTIRRYHRATIAVGDHDVALEVASEVAFGVDHFLPD